MNEINKLDTTNTGKAKKTLFWFILLTLIALTIHLWGTGFGLPHAFHPDEPKAMVYVKYCWDGNFSPYPLKWDPLYGTYTFILFFSQKIFFWFIKLLGYHPFLDHYKEFFNSSDLIFLLGRMITAIIGALTVGLSFLIGNKLFNKRTGITAALFLTFSMSHIASSHFIKPDIPVTFLIALTVLFSIFIYEKGKLWAYLLCGLCVGLAVATKINGCAVFISGLVAHLLYCRKNNYSWKTTLLNRNIFIFCLAIPLGVFIGCPYLFLDWKGFMKLFNWYLADQARGRGPIYFRFGWLHFIRNINSGIGLFLAIPGYCGILYASIRHKPKHLLLISFPLLYFVISGKSTFVAQRYTILVLPFIAIAGAFFLNTITDALFKKRLLNKLFYPIISIALLISPIQQTLTESYLLWAKGTRTIAERWLQDNIPPGSTIAVESYSPYIPKREYKVYQYACLGIQPLEEYEKLSCDYIITTDFAHNRYLYSQKKNEYQQYIDFYEDLNNKYPLIKEFYLKPVGFSSPHIKIYKLKEIAAFNPTPIFIPRPGQAIDKAFFLTGNSLYNENLRPFYINNYPATHCQIISKQELKQIGILLTNYQHKNTIKISTGPLKKSTIIELLPFEKKLLFIKSTPGTIPISYHYCLNLSSKKQAKTTAQILVSPYELALGYIDLGDWERAFPYLQKAYKDNPKNIYVYFLLSTAALKSTQPPSNITFPHIESNNLITDNDISFKLSTTYTPRDLNHDTGTIEHEAFYFNRKIDTPGLLAYGPFVHFPKGKYTAHFYLKGEKLLDSVLGKIEVSCYGGQKILAKKTIKGSNFFDNSTFTDFPLSFYNDNPLNELEFRVHASGNGNLWAEKVIVVPDINYCHRKDLAQFYLASGDYEKAAKLLPEDINMHQELADHYFKTNNMKKAALEYEKINQLNPINLNILEKLNKIYLQLNDNIKTTKISAKINALIPVNKKTINFEDKILFLGYKIDKINLKPGDTFSITYYWQCLQPIDRDYVIFVHFTKPNGKVKFQNDHHPKTGSYPTIIWKPGDIIKESYKITVPSDLQSGKYDIRIGLYDAFITNERAAITSSDYPETENRAIIDSLTIK